MPLSSCKFYQFAMSGGRSSSADATPLRIAIIGAGPAGLALARLLQSRERELLDSEQGNGGSSARVLDVAIYEAYKLGNGTREGGSLDLRQGTGLSAMEAAGLMDEFQSCARPDGQDLRVMDLHGEVLYREDSAIDDKNELFHPEIDRADLNRILRQSLEPRTIRWEHKLESIERFRDKHTRTKAFRLTFDNGEQAVADLVVGADGAWSKVRPLLSQAAPAYSGTTFLDCTLYDFDARYPHLTDFVGRGSVYAFSNGKVLFTQRNGKGILRVYLGFKATEKWRENSYTSLIATDPERSELLIKEYYSDWSQEFQQLIKAAGEQVEWRRSQGHEYPDKATEMVVRPLYELPVDHSWDNQDGVTIIGDAAHLMSPCAGEGVNMAMADALGLADAIAGAADRSELQSAIGKFESDMFARAGKAAGVSMYALRAFMVNKAASPADAAGLFDRSKHRV